MAGALPPAAGGVAAGQPPGGWTTPVGGTTAGESEPQELPGPGFPGATAIESDQSWPSGKQPERFQAWPQVGQGTAERTLLPCWETEVLHDVADGWPGLCLELFHFGKATTLEQCKHYCYTEPRCSVWQFNNQSTTPQCWVGPGLACGYGNGRTGLSVQGGQRLQHGSVRVLMDTSGMEILHLQQLGFFQMGSSEEQVQRCRSFCYSDLACQYWQYGEGGCRVDAPNLLGRGSDAASTVQFPLTTNGGASRTSERARTMIAGEYIQHYCPPRPAPALAAPRSALLADPMLGVGVPRDQGPAAAEGGRFQQVAGMLPILAAFALVLLWLVPIGYCISQKVWPGRNTVEGKRKSSSRKTRGLAGLEDERPLIGRGPAPRANAGEPAPPPPPPPALAPEVPARLSERRGFEVDALGDVEQAQQPPLAPHPSPVLPSPPPAAPPPPLLGRPPVAAEETRIWAPPQLGQRPLLLKEPSGPFSAGMPCAPQLRLH